MGFPFEQFQVISNELVVALDADLGFVDRVEKGWPTAAGFKLEV